jgi:hypothetical protein
MQNIDKHRLCTLFAGEVVNIDIDENVEDVVKHFEVAGQEFGQAR